jgi:hypothetical protein
MGRSRTGQTANESTSQSAIKAGILDAAVWRSCQEQAWLERWHTNSKAYRCRSQRLHHHWAFERPVTMPPSLRPA